MNCIIIDNNKQDSALLAEYISSVETLTLTGIFADVFSATKALAKEKTDLVFMEIALPGTNNIEFIKSINGDHNIIITSSSSGYALEAFELGVTDYLLKPFLPERFLKAVHRAGNNQPVQDLKIVQAHDAEYFFVKADNKFEKINKNDILYIEGLQNYITIQTATKKVITYSSLKSIENYLCEKEFLRVQKSFIVSISKIDSIDSDDVRIGKTSIPISRAIRENVLKTILNNRVYKYQC